MQSPRPRSSRLRRVLRAAGLAVACPVLLVLLNEYAFTSGTRARGGELKAIPVPAYAAARGGERDVKIMAYNIAKAFVNEDMPRFTERSTVVERLDRIADVIRAESPDLVFLSEVVWETPYNSVNQVRHLASACGFRYYAFGENSNVGLPFFRYVGGNAILSRWPLYNGDNPDLPGRQPFWVTRNNRRVLMADADIDGARVRCIAAHFDSFQLDNNLRQVRRILDGLDGWPTLVAGDFNARPGTPSMRAWAESGRFSGSINGPHTSPADKPDRRIDYVLAPREWRELSHHTTGGGASDHLAVVSVFRFRPSTALLVDADGS